MCDLIFEQIRKLNSAVNHRYRNDFPDDKIPILREASVKYLNHHLTIFFDIKGHVNTYMEFLNYTVMVSSALSCQKIICKLI